MDTLTKCSVMTCAVWLLIGDGGGEKVCPPTWPPRRKFRFKRINLVILGVMKTCTKCQEAKPFDSFRLNVRVSDGYDSWCKKCHNKNSELCKRKDKEKYNALQRAKYARRKARLLEAGHVPPGQVKRSLLTEEERRLRHNARRVTRRALADGKIVSIPCFVCGSSEVEAHHTDYSRPLDVVWLCAEHHREVHS